MYRMIFNLNRIEYRYCYDIVIDNVIDKVAIAGGYVEGREMVDERDTGEEVLHRRA